jgi:phage tail-like protein
MDRRGFLAGAAGLTGVALTVGAWKPVFAMDRAVGLHAAIAPVRQVKIGHILLTIGESPAGALLEAEGGAAFTDVIVTEETTDFQAKKLPGTRKFGNITLKRGMTADTSFFDWIEGSIGGRPVAHSGAIAGTDENFKLFTRTDFFNALITEVGFPALDAASKEAAKMTIKMQPESTRIQAGSGSVNPTHTAQQKSFVNNFKLTINGMNATFVTKIDQINIKLNYAQADSAAGQRLASIDIPNLKFTVPESRANDFISWHEDFVIKGNNSPENEKSGSLAFLSPDLKTEFFRLDLTGLGIFALDRDPLTLTNEVRNVTAQLFCNKMNFNFKF